MARGLTIGQAAAYVKVTIKTVRHYHRLGLVAEPRRDASGYRRYGAAELIRLARVRTLAEAGVPLGQIGELLDAEGEDFVALLDDVKRRLSERIAELRARRDMLDKLTERDGTLLPERARDLLDRAAELGFPPDYLVAAQEGIFLAKTVVPDFDAYVADVERSLEDPEYVKLLIRGWEVNDWDADDPRLEDMAREYADYLIAHPELLAVPTSLNGASDSETRSQLIDDLRPPGAARFAALLKARLRDAGIASG